MYRDDKNGAASIKHMKERQLSKIREVAEALVTSGFVLLDDQAKVLGVPRSTAWVILHGRYKKSGLTPKVVERMLSSQELPPLVRSKIIEYGEEKASGLYGQTTPQTHRFFSELALSSDTEVAAQENVLGSIPKLLT